MANNSVWQVLHLLCILAHIGMFVTGLVSFVITGSTDAGDSTITGLSWAAAGIGTFATGSNVGIFYYMLRLQNQPSNVTDDTQYLRRKLAFTTSLLIQITLATADIAIAAVIAGSVNDHRVLTSAVVLAVIAGIISLTTGITDVTQLRGYRKDFHGEGRKRIERGVELGISRADSGA